MKSILLVLPGRALAATSSVTAAILMLVGMAQAQTTLITPTLRAFSSEIAPIRPAIATVNGTGLSGTGLAADTHDNDAAHMWLSQGPGHGGTDVNPSLTFDLGEAVDLATTRVWAYNEPGFMSILGAENIQIFVSADDLSYESIGTITLQAGSGTANEPAQDFATVSSGVRYVRFNILSKFDGETYPDGVTTGTVGLSEVRFEAKGAPALKPTLTLQPQNQTNVAGATVTFTVTANDNGKPPLSYQWRKDGTALSNGDTISGATTATLTLTGITEANQGNYDVLVTNPNGSTPSSPASLTVDASGLSGPGLAADTHDNDAAHMWLARGAAHGGNDTLPSLTFDLGGVVDLVTTRVWAYNESSFTGSLGAENIDVLVSLDDVTYNSISTITLLQGSGAPGEPAQDFPTASTGVRYVRFNILSKFNGETYPDGVTVGTVGLSEVRFEANPLTLRPTLIQQPKSQTNVLGTSVTFTVTANDNGKPPLSYQWRKNGAALSNSGNVSGATTATLTLSNITAADQGNYDVVVTSPNGSVSSSSASLAVITVPSASIALHAGILFEGVVGVHYRVEYREALDQANAWKVLQDIPSLPSTPFRVYDPAPATHPQRFYRAIVP